MKIKMINRIRFKNYKIFNQKQEVEFKPITLLIGKNNSGKSALLKLPVLIEDALTTRKSYPIAKEVDQILFGNNYTDLVYGGFGRVMELELFQQNSGSGQEDCLIVHILMDNVNDQAIIERWQWNDEINLAYIEENLYFNELDGKGYICDFQGIRLLSMRLKEDPNQAKEIPDVSISFSTDYIGGFRQKPRKHYDREVLQEKSGIDGGNLYQVLINNFLSTDKGCFKLISNWVKDHFGGWELDVDSDKAPFPIVLKNRLTVNLAQTGVGIGQSLPLIIRAFQPCKEPTKVIIEEPEPHLHPCAHAEMAQLFAESLKADPNKSYFIETHSLNFVLRLRRLIAEGVMDKDSLAIYYIDFNEEKQESVLKRISVDERGGVDYWPEGVFNETTQETRAIYNAQLNDQRNVD